MIAMVKLTAAANPFITGEESAARIRGVAGNVM